MPNWVHNTMCLTETKKGALKEFINTTLKLDGYDVQVNSGQDWLDKMKKNQLSDNYKGIWLSTFIKRPETYDLYDTTNYPNGERLVLGQKIHSGEQEVIVTDEVVQSFKDATTEQLQKYGTVGWYAWNNKNYGCKWDTCLTEMTPEVIIVDGMESMILFFDTPWTEPLPIYTFLLNNYPNLDLKIDVYEELGGFGGSYSIVEDEGGRLLSWTDDEEYYKEWAEIYQL